MTVSSPRPKLTLSKPLSHDTLVKIKVKRSPQEVEAAKVRDKKNKRHRILKALDWLYTIYPDCFNKTDFKPLKLRIESDIFNSQQFTNPIDPSTVPSKKSLRDAISYYTHNIRYLKSHLVHSYRTDLQGQDILDDLVTEQHKEYAIQLMDKIKSKHHQAKLESTHKPINQPKQANQVLRVNQAQLNQTHKLGNSDLDTNTSRDSDTNSDPDTDPNIDTNTNIEKRYRSNLKHQTTAKLVIK